MAKKVIIDEKCIQEAFDTCPAECITWENKQLFSKWCNLPIIAGSILST